MGLPFLSASPSCLLSSGISLLGQFWFLVFFLMGMNRRRAEAQDRLAVAVSHFGCCHWCSSLGVSGKSAKALHPGSPRLWLELSLLSWPGLQQGWKCKTELLPPFPIFKLIDRVQAQYRSLKRHFFCLSPVREGKVLSLGGLLLSCNRGLHQI